MAKRVSATERAVAQATAEAFMVSLNGASYVEHVAGVRRYLNAATPAETSALLELPTFQSWLQRNTRRLLKRAMKSYS